MIEKTSKTNPLKIDHYFILDTTSFQRYYDIYLFTKMVSWIEHLTMGIPQLHPKHTLQSAYSYQYLI